MPSTVPHHVADRLVGRDDAGLEDRLRDRLERGGVRHLERVVEVALLAALHLELVDDARRGGDDVEAELAPQALLHDLHVEEAEEPAPEAEAEGDGALVVERERAVVEVELLEALLHLRKLVRGHRVDAAEHRGVDVVETGQRLVRAELRRGHRVADLDLARVLHRAHEVADLSGGEAVDRLLAGREDAHFVDGGRDVRAHERDALAGLHAAVHHAHVGDHAAELVEHAVEHERAQGRVRAARLRRRDALHDRLEHLGTPHARLRAHEERVVHRDREDVLDLAAHLLHVGAGEVHLVEDGHDLEVRVHREVGVRDGLGLHALRGVHHEKRALARAHRAAHLVGEVHVAGRVEEVEEIGLAVLRLVLHRHRMALDRDAAFALEVHGVEGLLLQLARADGVRELEDAVRQRGLAVVHMRDDAEVANVIECLFHVRQTVSYFENLTTKPPPEAM